MLILLSLLSIQDSLGHWERIYRNPIYGLYAIDFVDSLHGWTVGDFGIVLITEDGGESWDTVYAPVPNTWGYSLNDVHFHNKDMGWVCGDSGCIDKTIDGGSTWEVQNTGTLRDFYTIDFLDSLYGWAGGAGDSFLYKTTDGGETWTEVPFQDGDEDYGVPSISIISKDIIWVLCGYRAKLYKSTDGGSSWDLMVDPGGGWGDCVFTIDTQYVWASFHDDIYRSSDGGNTWDLTTGYPAWAMYFVDSLFGFVGGWNHIHVTFDGGETFYYSANTYDWLNDIDFVDRKHGWASLHYPENYPVYSAEIGKWFPDTSGIQENKPTETREENTLIFYSDRIKLGEGRFKIFDSSGRIIRVVEDEWNGRNSSGMKVSPGIYFATCKEKKFKIIKMR